MAEEVVETREIKLKADRPSGAYGIGTSSIEAEAGKTMTVSRKEARVAVASGNFEYAEKSADTKESLMRLKKELLVERAIKEGGASGYVSRLNKEQLVDYILIPAERARVEAEAEQRQQEELSKAAESGVEGETDANE